VLRQGLVQAGAAPSLATPSLAPPRLRRAQGEEDAKEIKIKQKGISSSAATVKKNRKFDSKY
jgi:hypothetical protein